MQETLLSQNILPEQVSKTPEECGQTGSELTPALRQAMADMMSEIMADVERI